MEYARSSSGLTVHTRDDWPCAVCRPAMAGEARGLLMCAQCARGMIFAVEAGYEDARELLDDVTDALALLDFHTTLESVPAN